MSETHSHSVPVLNDPALKAALQTLRATDDITNWWYLLRTYLYLGIVVALAVGFYAWQADSGASWWWNVPVTFAAIVLIGAGQHQLSGLAHEGVHHTLFRSRKLNDLASDLLTMFPLFGSTHHYRLQHLAHHQFVNDPDRDPDISQLRTSGHWLDFPVARANAVRTMLRQLWLPRLFKFMRVRAAYNATGTDKNPYLRKGEKPSKVAVRIGLAYILSLIVGLSVAFYAGSDTALWAVPLGLWLGACAVFARLPDRCFHRSRVHPVIPLRYMTMLRLGYITLLFTSLSWVARLTGWWGVGLYLLLWVVPMFTSFAFFMVLRQIVQHGNGDRGWLTNTRTFLQSPLVRFAVFPMGQDYHLPHHMYATIPHYRLGKLHETLMGYPEYRAEAVVVEGYFRPPHTPQSRPTVMDVLGPDYHYGSKNAIHLDHTVMDGDRFDEADRVVSEGRAAS